MPETQCTLHMATEIRLVRLEEKTTYLENQVGTNHKEICDKIDTQLTFFRERDNLFIKNMWRVVFGLIIFFILFLATVLGIETSGVDLTKLLTRETKPNAGQTTQPTLQGVGVPVPLLWQAAP